jgi:hypothetical protein
MTCSSGYPEPKRRAANLVRLVDRDAYKLRAGTDTTTHSVGRLSLQEARKGRKQGWIHIGQPTLPQRITPWNIGFGKPPGPDVIDPRSACPSRCQAHDNGRSDNGEYRTQSPAWNPVARYQRPAPQSGIDLMCSDTCVGCGEAVMPVRLSDGSRKRRGRTRQSTQWQNPSIRRSPLKTAPPAESSWRQRPRQ